MRSLYLLAFLFSCVCAELTCLQTGLLSPAAGLLCHFNHKRFETIRTTAEKIEVSTEQKAVATVENILTSLKDVGNFALSLHPVNLVYNFENTTRAQGLGAATNQLGQETHQILDMEIGVFKESANIVAGTANIAVHTLSIVALKHWVDAAKCVLKPAQYLRQRQPQGSLSLSQDSATDQNCLQKAFKAVARPAPFNITNQSQKVGATLADVGSLFVPIGAEGETGKLAAGTAYDLAIPGTEDAGRIYTYEADGKTARHFVSESEAQAVGDNLEDESWTGQQCASCGAPSVKSSSTVRRQRRSQLSRRVEEEPGLCCHVPEGTPAVADATETITTGSTDWDSDASELYSEDPNRLIGERELVTPPDLRLWEDVVADRAGILADLERTYTTSTVAWDPTVVAAFPPQPPRVSASQEVFHLLRDAFEGNSDELAEFRNEFPINREDVDAPGRSEVNSDKFINMQTTEPNMLKLQAFVKATTEQALTIAKVLKGVTDEQVSATLKSEIDFYYLPPGEENIATLDVRGQHVDAGVLQLGAADQPGLVLATGYTYGFDHYRVPIIPNGWYILPCTEFDGDSRWGAGVLHTVFGPEIMQHGRVSMIVNVRVADRSSDAWAQAVESAATQG